MSDNENKSEKTVIITQKVEQPERSSSLDPYLIQISGREPGHAFALKGKTVKIGREMTCEVSLDDPHVSRFHAEISDNGTELVLKDLGSTNGVFVNGKKIQESTIKDGDKILIGTRMYFKLAYQDSVEQNYQQNLFRAATLDNLTQLYNKKYFLEALSREFSFSRRNQSPLSLMMIDIDHFKKINDTYGHPAGDLVLKSIGQLLSRSLRLENVACRYGGEEFAIILRNVPADLAFQIAERVRKNIEASKIPYRNKEILVTISVGIATYDGRNFATIDDLVLHADDNLYEAKQNGRNQVILKRAA